MGAPEGGEDGSGVKVRENAGSFVDGETLERSLVQTEEKIPSPESSTIPRETRPISKVGPEPSLPRRTRDPSFGETWMSEGRDTPPRVGGGWGSSGLTREIWVPYSYSPKKAGPDFRYDRLSEEI